MSSAFVPRVALRQSKWIIQRRAASSTSDAAAQGASKAKEGASEATSKAQQGLSRVSSSAGSALGSAGTAATKTLSGIGGRTGKVISFAQGMVPPTIYYARVGAELAKIVVKGRNMNPPSMQTIQTYLTPVQNALRNPSSIMAQTSQTAQATAQSTAKTAANNPQSFLTRIRNMDTETLMTAGIVTAEVIGFFTVGEMIGRFKIVGYRGGHSEHH